MHWVKLEGRGHKVPAINKRRPSKLLNDFCIFSKKHFNILDEVFGKIFLLLSSHINSAQYRLKCVINFAHNCVIGLMIKSEHYFQ